METNNTNPTPFMATHPCEIVEDEIKVRGMSKKEFAKRMGMQPSNVSRFFRGETPISIEMAKRLENALGIPAYIWVNSQLQYETDVKNIAIRDAKEQTAATIENMLSSIMNMNMFYKRLQISFPLFIHEKFAIIQKLLGVVPQDIPQLNVCFAGNFKKSDKFTEDERNETTWRLLAYISAKQNKPNGVFAQGNAKLAACEIARATHNGNIKETNIKAILDKYGISYSVVEKVDKAPIDGFSAWVDGVPSIVTTHRYDDMARLVFTILHELGHIEMHLKDGDQRGFITTDNTYSSTTTEEVEANQFAEEILIDKKLWKAMMNVNSKLGSGDIVNTLKMLSKKNNLNFGIVSWRYKCETKKYALKETKPQRIS